MESEKLAIICINMQHLRSGRKGLYISFTIGEESIDGTCSSHGLCILQQFYTKKSHFTLQHLSSYEEAKSHT